MAIELQMTHPEVGISVLCPGWVQTQINRCERNRAELDDIDAGHDPNVTALKELIDGWSPTASHLNTSPLSSS